MLNKKFLTSLVVASGLTFGTMGVSFAHPAGGMMPPPPPPGEMPPPPPHHPGMFGPEVGPIGMIFQGVQLTKDQKSKIHDILASARKEEKTNRDSMKAIHDQMADKLLSPGKVTAEMLQPILDKQDAIEKTVKANHIKTILALRDVLTPEQLAKAKIRYTKIKSIKEQMKELREMDSSTQEDLQVAPPAP